MLTFLRKIRKSLIDSGSTRKYLLYAIGEIALVVIGILIALQFNNWSGQVRDRTEEKKLLIEINREFKENKDQFEKVTKAHKYAYQNTLALIEYFPINIELNHVIDSVGSKFIKSLERHTYNPSQGTINAMINNSSFNLIQNEELRRLLISWNDWVQDYQEDEIALLAYTQKFILPLIQSFNSFDFHDERNDLGLLTSLEFENAVKFRAFIQNDVSESEEYHLIKNVIDRIIELSISYR